MEKSTNRDFIQWSFHAWNRANSCVAPIPITFFSCPFFLYRVLFITPRSTTKHPSSSQHKTTPFHLHLPFPSYFLSSIALILFLEQYYPYKSHYHAAAVRLFLYLSFSFRLCAYTYYSFPITGTPEVGSVGATIQNLD